MPAPPYQSPRRPDKPCRQAMPRRGQQVPCNDCIQRASTTGHPGFNDLELCTACMTTLATRRSQQTIPLDSQSTQESPSIQQSTALLATLARQKRHALPHARSSETFARSTSTQLETLTQTFVDVVNNRDFTNPIWHSAVVGIEVAALDHFAPTTTLLENIRTFQTITTESPDYHLHVLSIDILESGDGRRAESYINMEVTGRPVGLVMNSAARMQWRRYLEDWLLLSFTAMRFSDLS